MPVRTDFDEMFKINIQKTIKSKARKVQVRTRTLSADLQLKLYDMICQFIDPAGSNRDVFLPEIVKVGSEYTKFPKNYYYFIFNRADASENLVIKFKVTIDGSPTTYTVLTLNQDEGCMLFCDGTFWTGFKGGKT